MGNPKKGFFTVKDSVCYTGTQLLLELWGAKHLTSLKGIEKVLTCAVKAAKATLLEIRLHHYSPNHGVSGVAIISESHISIHTWPEFDYAAIDIFVCGKVNPYKAVSVFKNFFAPKNIQISEIKRGIRG